MGKIDIDKFVAGLMGCNCKVTDPWLVTLKNALADQGLKYDPDMGIVEISPDTEEGIPHELKFKEGDWVVSPNGVYWHIDAIQNGRYQVSSDSGECAEWPLDTNIYHRFTIQDAKDGDVLDANGAVFLYGEHDKNYVYHYCGINLANEFVVACDEHKIWYIISKVHPATKEQKDTLFSKITEAGYEWDAENKVLKKTHKPDLDNTNGTDTIKFEKKGLTEFEKQLEEFVTADFNYTLSIVQARIIAKARADILMKIARKQIASEIEPAEIMKKHHEEFKDMITPCGLYMKGVKDTIEAIKGE